MRFDRIALALVALSATGAWAAEKTRTVIIREGNAATSNQNQTMTDQNSQIQTGNDQVTTSASAPIVADANAGGTRTIITEEEASDGGLKDEIVGIKPQAGVMSFTDAVGADTSRFAAGLTIDANFFGGIMTDSGKVFLGPSTGVIFSHLGSAGSNFFGLDSPVGGDGGDIFLVPLNAKLGYSFGQLRLAGHGGYNAIYRTSGGAVSFADNVAVGDSDWSLRPNIGGDLEIGLGDSVSLMLRPDWTFTDGSDIFTGTLALGFPLG